jgi:hypothetical protein
MGPANSIKEPMKSWRHKGRGQDFGTSLRYPRLQFSGNRAAAGSRRATHGSHSIATGRPRRGMGRPWGGAAGRRLSPFPRKITQSTQLSRSAPGHCKNSHRTQAKARPPPPSGNCNYNTERGQSDWTARVAPDSHLHKLSRAALGQVQSRLQYAAGGNCNRKQKQAAGLDYKGLQPASSRGKGGHVIHRTKGKSDRVKTGKPHPC